MADIAASGNFTPAELLAEVNKAIQAVLVGGQSYKIGSRSLTRADLNLLLSTRKYFAIMTVYRAGRRRDQKRRTLLWQY